MHGFPGGSTDGHAETDDHAESAGTRPESARTGPNGETDCPHPPIEDTNHRTDRERPYDRESPSMRRRPGRGLRWSVRLIERLSRRGHDGLTKAPSAIRFPTGLRTAAGALRDQWIFAALLALVWCAETLLTIDRGGHEILLLPGITALVVLALTARSCSLISGVLAAMVIAGDTALTQVLELDPVPGLLLHVSPTENAAGLLIVLYAFKTLPRSKPYPVAVLLVAACLLAVFGRGDAGDIASNASIRTLGLGFLQLVLAAGTGLYLRASSRFAREGPVRALLRKQWPVIAALCVLLFGQVFATDWAELMPGGLIVLISCFIMAGLAIFAPARPLQAAVLGAVNLVVTTVLTVLSDTDAETFLIGAIPIPVIAGGMLITAYVVRYEHVREATASTAALVAAAVFALPAMPTTTGRIGIATMLPALIMGGVLLVMSVGTGMYFRARDQERARSVEVAITNAQQAERMALARELHDVVAHHVTGIVVQAQAALAVADKSPQAARGALEQISGSGTEALTAMRRLVGSLRDAEESTSAETTGKATTDLHADLQTMAEHAREMARGPRVELDVRLRDRVPQEVARSALRIVQESVTNAEKHADGLRNLLIAMRTDDGELHISIVDDGSPADAQPVGGSSGYGLVGMRERIELLGGKITAGPGEHGGWRVAATLPLTDHRRDGAY